MSPFNTCPTPPKEKNPLLTAARAYCHAGYSLLPVAQDKRPALATWKPYQTQRPAWEEAKAWFRWGEVTGVGLIGGAVSSGLFIVDFDLEAESIFPAWRAKLGFPALTTVKTFKGYHVYFRCAHPPGCEKWARDEKGGTLIECKGEGGYCLAPPSLHPEGIRYRLIEGDLFNPQAFEVPDTFLDNLREVSASFNRSAPVVHVSAPSSPRPTRPRRFKSRLEWARFLLARLGPHRSDGVNDWLRVGGALQEFGEEGFTLWNEWSRQSRKYPGEEEMRRRWLYLGRTRKGGDHA